MKYHAPAYSEDGSGSNSHGSGDRRKMTGDDCPSQLTDERTELLELQWRDGCPVEQPVLDHRGSDNDDASSPGEKKNKATGDATGGEAVEEWWKMWREGESGGCAAAAAHGYPQLVDDLLSVNAEVATASVGPRQQTRTTTTTVDDTADELWRMWREGHGSSAPQDSSGKTSVLKGEESLLPSSAASRGSCGAPRHSSEQIDQQCSTLDQAIEYMKSLQQQIQVLSNNGYGMQPLLFPCICSQSSSHTAVPAATALAPAASLYPAPPPPTAAANMASLYQPLPPPQPAAAAADLNPVMVAAGGAPGGASGLIPVGTGLAEEMAWSTSEIPFGGCARCSFRRHAGDC